MAEGERWTIWPCSVCGDLIGRCTHHADRQPVEVVPGAEVERLRWHLLPGDLLVGYCGGYFGRDSYGNKRVEAVGADWVVARDEHGVVECAFGESIHEQLREYVHTDAEAEVERLRLPRNALVEWHPWADAILEAAD